MRGVWHHYYFLSPGTSKGVIWNPSKALEKEDWKGSRKKYTGVAGERKQSPRKIN